MWITIISLENYPPSYGIIKQLCSVWPVIYFPFLEEILGYGYAKVVERRENTEM